jgi:hypothetical protein
MITDNKFLGRTRESGFHSKILIDSLIGKFLAFTDSLYLILKRTISFSLDERGRKLFKLWSQGHRLNFSCVSQQLLSSSLSCAWNIRLNI